MSQYRFSLEIYNGMKSKYRCPQCGRKKSFKYYIDVESGGILNEKVGKCDHLGSCNYHYPPRQYFQDNGKSDWYNKQIANFKPPPPAPISFFDKKYLIETETNFKDNYFIQFLLTIYDRNAVFEAVKKYRIGTHDCWLGATVFWYLDRRNRVRSGKVMLYNKATGKRLKINGVPRINSMRSILIKKGLIDANFNQKTGLFGEHLLADKQKEVRLVESEKTALIMAINEPDYLWLASGGLSQLSIKRMQFYKKRIIVFYPDLGAYEKWNQKAGKLNKIGFIISTSTLLEEKATARDKTEGFDIADYFIMGWAL